MYSYKPFCTTRQRLTLMGMRLKINKPLASCSRRPTNFISRLSLAIIPSYIGVEGSQRAATLL